MQKLHQITIAFLGRIMYNTSGLTSEYWKTEILMTEASVTPHIDPQSGQ